MHLTKKMKKNSKHNHDDNSSETSDKSSESNASYMKGMIEKVTTFTANESLRIVETSVNKQGQDELSFWLYVKNDFYANLGIQKKVWSLWYFTLGEYHLSCVKHKNDPKHIII